MALTGPFEKIKNKGPNCSKSNQFLPGKKNLQKNL
jgi:hypothetical protein